MEQRTSSRYGPLEARVRDLIVAVLLERPGHRLSTESTNYSGGSIRQELLEAAGDADADKTLKGRYSEVMKLLDDDGIIYRRIKGRIPLLYQLTAVLDQRTQNRVREVLRLNRAGSKAAASELARQGEIGVSKYLPKEGLMPAALDEAEPDAVVQPDAVSPEPQVSTSDDEAPSGSALPAPLEEPEPSPAEQPEAESPPSVTAPEPVDEPGRAPAPRTEPDSSTPSEPEAAEASVATETPPAEAAPGFESPPNERCLPSPKPSAELLHQDLLRARRRLGEEAARTDGKVLEGRLSRILSRPDDRYNYGYELIKAFLVRMGIIEWKKSDSVWLLGRQQNCRLAEIRRLLEKMELPEPKGDRGRPDMYEVLAKQFDTQEEAERMEPAETAAAVTAQTPAPPAERETAPAAASRPPQERLLSAMRAQYEERLARANARTAQLIKAVETSRAEAAGLRDRLDDLRGEVSQLRQAESAMRTQVADSRRVAAEADRLRSQLAQVSDDNERLSAAQAEHDARLLSLTAERDALQRQVAELQDDLEMANGLMSAPQGELARADDLDAQAARLLEEPGA